MPCASSRRIRDSGHAEPAITHRKPSIRQRFGYEARFTHFPILGLCESCSAELAEGSAGTSKGGRAAAHESHTHEHSHGDHVHSHPHAHPPGEHGHTHD